MFRSKFDFDKELAFYNAELMMDSELYVSHMEIMSGMDSLSMGYVAIPDMHRHLYIKPFLPLSKRKLYESYDSGVVVGAGGRDCNDLVGDNNWRLFDLTDTRMINKAVGHSNGVALFNIISDEEGNTLVDVDEKYIQSRQMIDVTNLDSIDMDSCDLISIDAEGSGYDIIVGSLELIDKHSPDLLISIYHNWQEYLLIPPVLYDMGYDMKAVKTSPTHGNHPHLDLAILCTRE